MARPKVRELGIELAKAGLLGEGQLLREHESATTAAVASLKEELDAWEAAQVDSLLAAVSAAAAQEWELRKTGRSGAIKLPRAQWTALAADEHVAPNGGSDQPFGAGGGVRGLFEGDDVIDDVASVTNGASRLTVDNFQR